MAADPDGHHVYSFSRHYSAYDPDDEWVAAEATRGGADVLVTGDAAILKLGKRAPLTIVAPRGLWDLLRGEDDR